MMLPQEKFAFKYLYEGNFLGQIPVSSQADIENLMSECGIRYRINNGIKDLREAFWGYGSLAQHAKGYDVFVDWCLERLDKVVTIDWVHVYRNKYGSVRI